MEPHPRENAKHLADAGEQANHNFYPSNIQNGSEDCVTEAPQK